MVKFGNAWDKESIGLGRQISRALVVYAFYSFLATAIGIQQRRSVSHHA